MTATGDAVGNPSQDLLDCTLQKNCSTSFTVNLKQMGFMQNTIDISAEIVDAGLNRTTSNHLTFMINADTMCPVVTIQGPMGSVNAGDSRQASILVADNQMGDTGVKRVVVDISGEALVEAVHSDVTLPQAIPMATRLVPFAVKKAEDLANVMDKTITISAQAFDAAMPPNGCDPQMSTLTVLGVLDHCTGDITTSKAADCIGKPFTITVTLTGTAVANVDHVISTNPVGTFPLVPQGNGVYTVTLFFEGQGSFSLKFIALDKDNNELCSGSIGLTATGPCQGENGALQHGADDLAGATDHAH